MSTPSLLGLAFLQEEPSATYFLVALLVVVAIYAYFSLCIQKMAQKTNAGPLWWAWVPIIQVFLLLKIAGRPLWWFILLLIPIVSLIVIIVVWVDICKALQKSPWLVVGMLIPLVNFVVLGYLAFSD